MIETLLADAKVITTVSAIVALATAIIPVIPEPYRTIVIGVCSFLTIVFHLTSHTEASLGAVARKRMGVSL